VSAISHIKVCAAKLLGEKNVGYLDYFLSPNLKESWEGPFNGQHCRQRIFSDLVARVAFNAIVETGTFRGSTTGFLATFGLPVYTVEVNARFYAYSALRLFRRRHTIHRYQGDSATFLRGLANNEQFPKSNVLFYLDAHWGEHLPLREEIEVIFTNWNSTVVMVDDFQVPGTDYGYDDYGPGKVLNMSYLEPIQYLQLHAFFPVAEAKQETGAKRGSVVLCRDEALKDALSEIDTLTPWDKR
jgi:hypothetical protein